MKRGAIKVVIKQGTPKSPHFEFYPFWMLKVVGRNGDVADVAPSYLELKQILLDILTHELIVDRVYGRKPDFTKYRGWLKDLLQEDLIKEAQTRLEHFSEIPTIYTDFVALDHQEEFEKIWGDTIEKNKKVCVGGARAESVAEVE